MKIHPIPRTIIRFAANLHHVVPAAIRDFLHHVFCGRDYHPAGRPMR